MPNFNPVNGPSTQTKHETNFNPTTQAQWSGRTYSATIQKGLKDVVIKLGNLAVKTFKSIKETLAKDYECLTTNHRAGIKPGSPEDKAQIREILDLFYRENRSTGKSEKRSNTQTAPIETSEEKTRRKTTISIKGMTNLANLIEQEGPPKDFLRVPDDHSHKKDLQAAINNKESNSDPILTPNKEKASNYFKSFIENPPTEISSKLDMQTMIGKPDEEIEQALKEKIDRLNNEEREFIKSLATILKKTVDKQDEAEKKLQENNKDERIYNFSSDQIQKNGGLTESIVSTLLVSTGLNIISLFNSKADDLNNKMKSNEPFNPRDLIESQKPENNRHIVILVKSFDNFFPAK